MKYSVALLAAASVVYAQQAEWQQCGGINWSGGTTCVSGTVCTKYNDYYSQCTPGTGTSAPAPSPSSGLPRLGGVNTAGYDFSVATDGSFNGTGVSPPPAQFTHFAKQGANLFRIPWQLMTPEVGGPINETWFSNFYDVTVQSALSSSPNTFVIVDLHNYARWNGQIIAQGGPTNDQFASVWTQLAQKYGSNERVIFGIMNEPHDVPDIATWVDSVQFVVNAVRNAGSKNFLLLPGSSWSSAQAFPTEAGPLLVKVTDPLGDTSKLIFDVHKYLDSDNSGTHPDCTTDNVDVLTTLVSFLKSNGNRQAILSETGGGNTASCETLVGNELSFVKNSFPTLVGFSAWSAGAFDTTYTLTLTPFANGTDEALWTSANLTASYNFASGPDDCEPLHSIGMYTTDPESTRLQSITQERDLDEFLNTATLAGVDFTAERRNVKIIAAAANSNQNPYLLSEEEERTTLRKQSENKQRLRVPRRPPWTKSMTTAQLDRQEKDAFLEWRRGLAELQDRDQFLLTPFERNIEVWRQLWRVLERSHLVVQIVDARNPLRFRCEDLEAYVQDVEGTEGEAGTGKGKRRSLLLINKADLLTARQRKLWADYFDERNVKYAFFSAANAAAIQEARREAAAAEAQRQGEATQAQENAKIRRDEDVSLQSERTGDADNAEESDDETPSDSDGRAEESTSDEEDDDGVFLPIEEGPEASDPRTRVLSVLELEDLFVRSAPDLSTFVDSSGEHPAKLVVGLVGYPNVGKSSTINALVGEKKVSVSSTPGKTKHFQTIHLSSTLVLCDCPGLVFPQFATTKADLVCDGVLPIDQMREYTAPTTLVVRRIPKEVLEAIYGLSIRIKSVEEGGEGKITGPDLLVAYAIARGFARSGQGNPDEARAARYILKDYVNAKLLFCHPPPSVPDDDFNEQTRQIALLRAVGKKRAPTTRVTKKADTFVAPAVQGDPASTANSSQKGDNLDREFFTNGSLSSRPYTQGARGQGQEFSRAKLYPHQNMVADDGTPLTGRRARIAAVLAAGGDVAPGKKHHKKMKRGKQRSGKGYDD
uniref:Beta-xylanase (EC) n=1 Tax=Ganoderma boninense TaxID=34458 RepID=A0A5K1JRG7_9APHY|nr:Beta-xylanase (EC [Ganoderma boninense]